MRCSKCSFDNPAGMKFCGQCTAALALVCPQCRFENPPGFKFCGQCRTALPSLPLHPPPAQSPFTTPDTDGTDALEGERKTVTALFADIKGSTEFEQDLDPEEARAIVDPALKLMIEAIRRYGGYVVQSTGDGIFALLGAPVAHEDHPQRALYAALRMQEDLRRYSARLVAEGGNPLQCRVGINTGEVVIRSIATGGGQTEYTPIGHTTNLASRMQAVAPVGSVAVAEPTRKLCEGYFVLKPLGPTRVKGVTELVNVYEVVGIGPLRTRLQRSAGRGLTKFVGREREIEALEHAVELAQQRHGQIVAAVAEAGIGKSRLFYEFKVKHQSDWMVLEAFSVSHGKASSYLPVIDLLCSYFRIGEEDDARTRREKIAGRLAILDPSLENTRPYIFALLGIVEDDEHSRRHWEQSFDRLDEYLHGVQAKDPLAQMDVQIRRRRTLDAIKRVLLRESLNQPLILVFEDLHWIDEQTQALLDLLADSIGTSRILILVNYRPEYSHAWTNKTYYTQLRLDPLSGESAARLLTGLIGDEASLKPLRDLVVQKTEGNPFFMEEIVQGLFEEGALTRNGITKLTRPLDTLKIPTTVQATLASRIDRLPLAEKDLLQTLAVIGKEFGLGLVRAVSGKSDDELTATLSALQLAEFLYEQPAMGEVEYTFKHALTQEVAYGSVLLERRKLLHGRIGAAIEQQFADRLEDHLGELAGHYGRSHHLTKALDYMARAAEQAGQRSAYSEAIALINSASALLASLPESEQRDRDELRLRVTLGPALMAVKGFSSEETRHSCERACEIARRLHASTALFAVLNFLWGFHYARGDAKSTLTVSHELMAIAEQLSDVSMLKDAHRAMGGALAYTGDLLDARRHLEKGLSLGDSPRTWGGSANLGPDTNMLCLTQLSEVLLLLGYPQQALRMAYRALDVVDVKADSFSLAMALTLAAQMHNYRREPGKAMEIANRALALCDEYGYPFWMSVAKRVMGWALMLDGKAKPGIELMEAELARFTGAEGDMVRYQTLLNTADAYRMIGERERAMVILEQWQRARQNIALVLNDPRYHRLRGKILLETGADKEAQEEFLESMAIAKARNDKWHELQAVLALAPLLIKQEHRDEARTMLADVCGWFTEGFETADLKEAKTLLDELAG